MTPILATALIVHVLVGILGIGMLNVILMHLLKRAPNYNFLSRLASWAAVSFWVSWATSAYYYVTYYGKAVKPRILEGSYPFAHNFFMEAKEHLFLILPFAALSLAAVICVLRITPDDGLKRAATFLAAVAMAIGVFVAAAGIVVSGSI